jgi:hypothetical protein
LPMGATSRVSPKLLASSVITVPSQFPYWSHLAVEVIQLSLCLFLRRYTLSNPESRSISSRIMTINGRKLTACYCSWGPNLRNCPEACSDIPCPLETQGGIRIRIHVTWYR